MPNASMAHTTQGAAVASARNTPRETGAEPVLSRQRLHEGSREGVCRHVDHVVWWE
jgi:hypothetical protein